MINCVFIFKAGKCVWINLAILEIRGLVQLNQGSEAGEDSLGNLGTTKSQTIIKKKKKMREVCVCLYSWMHYYVNLLVLKSLKSLNPCEIACYRR